jgi:hypothetical protein
MRGLGGEFPGTRGISDGRVPGPFVAGCPIRRGEWSIWGGKSRVWPSIAETGFARLGSVAWSVRRIVSTAGRVLRGRCPRCLMRENTMKICRLVSVASLLGAAGMAVAQPTVDGIFDAGTEGSFYGDILWTNNVATAFGDNNAGDFTGGNFGNPEAVATGVEIRVPLASLGLTGSETIRISGWVNSGDRTFKSNQIIGALPIDTTNLGGAQDFKRGQPRGDHPACDGEPGFHRQRHPHRGRLARRRRGRHQLHPRVPDPELHRVRQRDRRHHRRGRPQRRRLRDRRGLPGQGRDQPVHLRRGQPRDQRQRPGHLPGHRGGRLGHPERRLGLRRVHPRRPVRPGL